MSLVRWSSSARTDLRRVRAYYDLEAPEQTGRIVWAFIDRAKVLCEFPESGPQVGNTPYRKLTVRGLPYILLYRLVPGGTEIVAVRHTAQNWVREL